MFAGRMHQQIPNVVIDEHARPIMKQIPTHKVKITTFGRFIDRERKVVTALRGAVFAQIRGFGVIGTTLFRAYDGQCD